MFRYTVTKEDFTEMSVYLMKQKSKTLGARIKLVLFTVVQMAVIAYLILTGTNVSLWIRVLMGVFSVLWAAQTIFQFVPNSLRAKMMLMKQKDEDPTGEFWKEHKLAKRGNIVSISYGSKKADVESSQITGTQETENLTLLMSGNGIVEIVPRSVTGRPEWARFVEELGSDSAKALRQAQEKQRAEVLEAAVFKEYIVMSEEEVAGQLVKMKRHSLRFFAGWTPVTIIIFLLPLIFVSFFASGGQWLYAGIFLGVFFLLNAGQLMIFTPLYKKAVLKNVEPAGEGGYLLAVTRNRIHLYTRTRHYSFLLKDLKRVVEQPEASYYYFPQQEMVFVPARCREAFKEALSFKPSLHDLAEV